MRISDWSSDVCSSDLFDSLRRQPVDFLQQQRQRAPPILVAEVFLGAERAVIGTAARCLDLCARAGRLLVEAMVMVAVTLTPFLGPGQRRKLGESGGLIGSAACRARECTYVEFSVVATSLKKTVKYKT